MKILAIILLLMSGMAMAKANDDSCPIADEFPQPSWIQPIQSLQLAENEAEAKRLVEEDLSRQVIALRTICMAHKGEAYWHRYKEMSCFPVGAQVACLRNGETECEAKDF